MPATLTPEIIAAAILGFEQQKLRIDASIAELRAMQSGGATKPAATPKAPTAKRTMSAAGRRAVAEAQRKRWAAAKQQAAPPAPEPAKPKRKLSKAGKAAIIAATKKRWAAIRAAKEAAKAQVAPVIAKNMAVKKTARKKATKKMAPIVEVTVAEVQ